jgi:hypothetical protein
MRCSEHAAHALLLNMNPPKQYLSNAIFLEQIKVCRHVISRHKQISKQSTTLTTMILCCYTYQRQYDFVKARRRTDITGERKAKTAKTKLTKGRGGTYGVITEHTPL